MVAVVFCGIAAHVKLFALGMKRNDRVPVTVHEFAAGPYAIADPFVEDLSLGIRNINAFNLIGSLPRCPVLQVQTRVFLDSIRHSVVHLAAATDKHAKRLSGVGIDRCTRKIDGVVVDDPVAARGVY